MQQPLKGYIVDTGARLTPFGDAAHDLPIANAPLREHTDRALRAAGAASITTIAPGELIEGPALVATDDLYLAPRLASRFAADTARSDTPAALAIQQSFLTDFTAPLQDLSPFAAPDGQEQGGLIYPLAFVPSGARATACPDQAVEGAAPRALTVDHTPLDIPMHRALLPAGKLVLPFGDENIIRLRHWLHLLRANQLALLGWGAHLLRRAPLRLLWAALRALSFNRWRVMQKLVVCGPGCDIHPSAVVEGSILGANVRVGAHAIVRFSNLADGAVVSDLACVEYSMLGRGASVSRTGMLQSCVLLDGANTGLPGVQLSVIGRDTFIGGEVKLADFKPAGNVRVHHNGRLVDTGTNLLGCAVGHDARLMMGAAFYPGREIPNGLTIIGPTDDVVSRIDPDLPRDEVLVTRGGGLIPYRGPKG